MCRDSNDDLMMAESHLKIEAGMDHATVIYKTNYDQIMKTKIM